MKAFIIALAVFALTAGFAIFSSLMLASSLDALIAEAEELPAAIAEDGFEMTYAGISLEWQKLRAPVRYFAGHTESDLVDDTLSDVKAYFRENDAGGYSAARAKLISQLGRIKCAEKFSCDSLF